MGVFGLDVEDVVSLLVYCHPARFPRDERSDPHPLTMFEESLAELAGRVDSDLGTVSVIAEDAELIGETFSTK